MFPGPDGWKATVDNNLGPNDALFRWSPRHQDLEVISTNSLPVYLTAPGEMRTGPAAERLLFSPLLSFHSFLASFCFHTFPFVLTDDPLL